MNKKEPIGAKSKWWVDYGLIAVLTVALLYGIKASQISGMSMSFAGAIKEGYWDFQSHHLLYQPVMLWLYRLFGSSGCDPVCAGQIWSIFWAAVTILCTYTLGRRALGSRSGAALAALFVLSSHGFIVFATQLEPYVPVLGMLSLLAVILVQDDGPPHGRGWSAIFIAVFALALFHHQAAVFFLVPATYLAVSAGGKAGLRWIALISLCTGIPVLLVFAAVYWSLNPNESVGGFVQWLLYYAIVLDSSHGSFLVSIATENISIERIKEASGSLTQMFVILPPDADLWDAGAREFGRAQRPVRFLVTAVLPVVFLWHVIQAVRRGGRDRLRVFLLVWWATFGLFAYWWQASVHKFFIPTLVPAVLLAGWMLRDIGGLFRSKLPRLLAPFILGATGGLMLYANLQSTVLALHQSRGEVFDLARRFHEAAPAECVLYTKRYLGPHLGYYFDRTSRPFRFMFKKHVYEELDRVVAGNIHSRTDFEDDACGVIPVYWVSREFFVHESGQASGRFLAPEDWERFVSWFFDVRPEASSGEVTYSAFEVIEDTGGEPYLLIDRTSRATAESLGSISSEILEIHAAAPESAFSPSGNPAPDRLRRIAFGYN